MEGGQGKVKRGKNRKMKVKAHQRAADKREGGYAAVQGVNKEDQRTEWWRRESSMFCLRKVLKGLTSSPVRSLVLLQHKDTLVWIVKWESLALKGCCAELVFIFLVSLDVESHLQSRSQFCVDFFSSIHSLFFRFLLHNFPAPVKERSTRNNSPLLRLHMYCVLSCDQRKHRPEVQHAEEKGNSWSITLVQLRVLSCTRTGQLDCTWLYPSTYFTFLWKSGFCSFWGEVNLVSNHWSFIFFKPFKFAN